MLQVVTTAIILLLGLLFVFEIQKKSNAFEKKIIWFSFFAHILSTFALLSVYIFYYGYGDILTYQRYGETLAKLLEADFFEYSLSLLLSFLQQENSLGLFVYGNGSSTGSMTAFTGFVSYVTQGSIVGTSVVFSLLTFSGQVAMYRSLKSELEPGIRNTWMIACMLIPSFVFWTSGILKESVACFGMGWVMYSFMRILRGKRVILSSLILLISLPFVLLIKGYIFVVLIFSLGMYFLRKKTLTLPMQKGLIYAGISIVTILLIMITLGNLFPRLSFENFAEEANRLQEAGTRIKGGSDYSLVSSPQRSFFGQILYAPLALIASLFRPFFFEANNFVSLMNALETTFYFFLFMMISVSGIRKKMKAIFLSPTLFMMASFVLIFAIGVGLTTTNMGTLSRYRIPMMPFYVTLLLVLSPKVRFGKS